MSFERLHAEEIQNFEEIFSFSAASLMNILSVSVFFNFFNLEVRTEMTKWAIHPI